jgi:hypothetical protein
VWYLTYFARSNRLFICKVAIKAPGRPYKPFLGSDALSYRIGARPYRASEGFGTILACKVCESAYISRPRTYITIHVRMRLLVSGLCGLPRRGI